MNLIKTESTLKNNLKIKMKTLLIIEAIYIISTIYSYVSINAWLLNRISYEAEKKYSKIVIFMPLMNTIYMLYDIFSYIRELYYIIMLKILFFKIKRKLGKEWNIIITTHENDCDCATCNEFKNK